MPPNILKSSLQNASFNIIFQIGFRILTFLMNAFVLRHISQDVIGVMNVRLLLLESTIQFLSREAFRRACLSKTSERNWSQIVNLVWLTLPLCLVICIIAGYFWLNVLPTPDRNITEYYTLGVWAVAISCLIETCCEPAYILAEAFLFVRLKIVMQTMLVVIRTIAFTAIVLYRPEAAVFGFAVAQLLSVAVYTLGFYVYFYFYLKKRKEDRLAIEKEKITGRQYTRKDSIIGTIYDFPFNSTTEFFPSWTHSEGLFDYKLASLTWSFFKQGFLKQILTEGERYIMTFLSVLSFSEQGVYDVVNNLGSMAARFLFRPIEDSSYFYFTQMIQRDIPISDQDKKHVAEASLVLQRSLRCLVSFGVVVLVFGQAYSRLVLLLYGGAGLVLGSGPLLLRTHCLSILFLAVNGITECYALATMDTKQLDKYNYVIFWLSIGFLAISWLLTSLLGGVGFILANCCNMAARIAHSVLFISEQYRGSDFNPLLKIAPPHGFLALLVVCGIVTQVSEVFVSEHSMVAHFGVGAVAFLCTLAVWLYEERELVSLALVKWKWSSKKSD